MPPSRPCRHDSNTRGNHGVEIVGLAHSGPLLSDLTRYDDDYRHGMDGIALAAEAGSNDAIIRSALAKTLRWEERLVESADVPTPASGRPR